MITKDHRKRVVYELARHRDLLLRRNLLLKALDASDYSTYAYYGSKKNYQLLYRQDSGEKSSPLARFLPNLRRLHGVLHRALGSESEQGLLYLLLGFAGLTIG